MSRLYATIWCDIRLQVRNGFYYAALFVLLVWILILTQVPLPSLAALLPALILGNLLINTFYFVAGLVLLEKGERTLQAQVVTPLRTWEYLASKVVTLALLAMVETTILVAFIYGTGFRAAPLLAGMATASAILVLAGFVSVARFTSINEYLFPSVAYSSLLTFPMVPYIAGWDSWLLYLHPMQAPLVLMKAAFQSVEPWQVVYSLLYSGLWIWLAYLWSRREFRRFVVAA
jgi:fluoroquinolone transport system permease protein